MKPAGRRQFIRGETQRGKILAQRHITRKEETGADFCIITCRILSANGTQRAKGSVFVYPTSQTTFVVYLKQQAEARTQGEAQAMQCQGDPKEQPLS